METKKLTRCALLIAAAMVLSWVESLIPLSAAVPGMKVGLPNVVVIFALYRLGTSWAWLISLVRVVLVALTFGNAFSLWYSLAGAVLSLLIMWGLKAAGKFSIPAVSVTGGVCHNVGQMAVAMAVLQSTATAYYLPPLLLSGMLAGAAIGAAGAILVKRIRL